jgi:hypothetical protein
MSKTQGLSALNLLFDVGSVVFDLRATRHALRATTLFANLQKAFFLSLQ